MQIRNLRQEAKRIKLRKNTGTYWDKKEKTSPEKMTIQLEKLNQKVQTKKGRLKRYRQRVIRYRQNRTFQNNERTFYLQSR